MLSVDGISLATRRLQRRAEARIHRGNAARVLRSTVLPRAATVECKTLAKGHEQQRIFGKKVEIFTTIAECLRIVAKFDERFRGDSSAWGKSHEVGKLARNISARRAFSGARFGANNPVNARRSSSLFDLISDGVGFPVLTGYDGVELLSLDLPRNGSQKGHCADFQDAKKESPESPSGTGSSVRSG